MTSTIFKDLEQVHEKLKGSLIKAELRIHPDMYDQFYDQYIKHLPEKKIESELPILYKPLGAMEVFKDQDVPKTKAKLLEYYYGEPKPREKYINLHKKENKGNA